MYSKVPVGRTTSLDIRGKKGRGDTRACRGVREVRISVIEGREGKRKAYESENNESCRKAEMEM
jgi:hypothetical protein